MSQKLFNTDEALGTESGQRESAKEHLKLREQAGGGFQHREQRSPCHGEGHSFQKSVENSGIGERQGQWRHSTSHTSLEGGPNTVHHSL